MLRARFVINSVEPAREISIHSSEWNRFPFKVKNGDELFSEGSREMSEVPAAKHKNVGWDV